MQPQTEGGFNPAQNVGKPPKVQRQYHPEHAIDMSIPRLPLPNPARPVLIAGPTASGKSALALEIAQAQGRIIVNADALQVHTPWRIVSARPSDADEALVAHHLYGHVRRGAEYSVGHWLREVADILQTHPNPVIVGGTGLYLTALTEGLAQIPATPHDIRAQADALLATQGLEALLAALDPETLSRIDIRNPARVQRAYEVLQATGTGLAGWQDQTGAPLLPLSQVTPLVLMPDRDWLNARIGQRFAAMIDEGALDEARAALPHWPLDAGTPTAALWTRAIGAPELIAHLKGYMSLPDAIESATLATRQYAKRQRSWFRNRMKDWQSVALP